MYILELPIFEYFKEQRKSYDGASYNEGNPRLENTTYCLFSLVDEKPEAERY